MTIVFSVSTDESTQEATAAANARGEGFKADAERDRWDLLPVGPVREVVRVLTYGCRKYAAWNWVKVPGARDRYYAAMLRHLTAWRQGEQDDAESGLSHLAHAICCAVFLRALELGDTGPDREG